MSNKKKFEVSDYETLEPIENRKLGKLTKDQLLRVKACAVIYGYDTTHIIVKHGKEYDQYAPIRERIAKLADQKQIDYDRACYVYALGICKKQIRTGQAKNYNQAIEQIENIQCDWRGDALTRTISREKTDRTVAKYNRKNKGDKITMDGITYITDYKFARIDTGDRLLSEHRDTLPDNTPIYNQGDLVTDNMGLLANWQVIDNADKIKRECNIGKVLGTMYNAYNDALYNYEPINEIDRQEKQLQLLDQDKHNYLFFRDYLRRISNTARKWLYTLARDNTDISVLVDGAVRAGKKHKQHSTLANVIGKIWQNFPHKNAMSESDFIALVRHYLAPKKADETNDLSWQLTASLHNATNPVKPIFDPDTKLIQSAYTH